ncbi:MAG: PIN domain-containing protein [Pseudonocardiaceae bacterium]|nr:PIN domain-containing protein [Pseudonocardiaceae bacterium]
MAVLIDTSVFVAVERGSCSLAEFIRPDQRYALSVVTAAELLHGVHRASGRREQDRSAFVEGLLAGFGTVPLDLTIARAYARISAELAAAGTPVDANDLWIAATAVARGLEVLALDGDFDRIPGVRRIGLPG